MYRIYSGNELIYAPQILDGNRFVDAPILTMEINRSSVLEFELPPESYGYDRVDLLKSIIKVYDGEERLFRGRCLHSDTLMSNSKKMYCEGELSFLNDSVVMAYAFEGKVKNLFIKLVNDHNAQVGAEKRFAVGNITVDDKEDTIKCESTTYPTTLEEMQKQLIDEVGGYIIPRYEIENGVEVEYLDYLQDASIENGQDIAFGKNLTDISQRNDGEDVFTVLIPLGASTGKKSGVERRVNIKSVNDNKVFLRNEDAVAEFGVIYKAVIWDKVKDPAELKRRGQKYLDSGANDSVEISLSAIDLHLLDPNIDAIRLGEKNLIYSSPHGFNSRLACSKITLDLENPERSQYSFGKVGKTLTGMQHATNLQVEAVTADVGDLDADLEDMNVSYEEMSDKVGGIEDGAQVNRIETITVNGVAVTITDKNANIIIP